MGFGGGDEPSNTQYATQYQREAPEIEAAKLGLMGTARDLTRFGTNPWELINKDAELGDSDYRKYEYTGTDGRYAEGAAYDDLTREQRTLEGQVNIPQQQMAGFNKQQNQAFNLSQEGVGAYQPYMDAATTYANAATQQYDPNDPNSGIQSYMNPYQDFVTKGIEDQFAKAQNQANMAANKAGAFGGSRSGIQSAELGGQQAQAVGQSLAQNYGQAQQASMQNFQNQMGRYGAASGQMAGLGGQLQQQNQADIASLMASGSVQQQFAQQGLDNQYRQNIQQVYEPYQRLGFTSDIYQGMPTSAMATSMGTAPGTNPLAQTVGAGIMGLAGSKAV
jgi:hypothetical protein|tara:strand:- start:849 stop:1850 length:1002 start_codon:yes stop_codon:yes gene_type:complete